MKRDEPKPGQESVWDYPRPPRVEATQKRIRVIFNGAVIADTQYALRVLETSHPPVYYVPPEDISREYLTPTHQRIFASSKESLVLSQSRVLKSPMMARGGVSCYTPGS